MRTFRATLLGAFLSLSIATAPGAAVAGEEAFQSVREALALGVNAFDDGDYDLAQPALAFAAREDFVAQYYLARIYGDAHSRFADRGKAYALYQRIADEHTDADPDDDVRAPFVGKALTALARYVAGGVPEVGVVPDAAKAASYLRYAALFFRDEDAQFELAKIEIKADADGNGESANAKHWLAVLSQEGHANAQAFLAGLYWRGDHMDRDPSRALALATLAVTNAEPDELAAIEAVHRTMFCASSPQVRQQASAVIATWKDRFERKRAEGEKPITVTGSIEAAAATCADGEPVIVKKAPELPPGMAANDGAHRTPPGFVHGAATDGLRDVGTTVSGPSVSR